MTTDRDIRVTITTLADRMDWQLCNALRATRNLPPLTRDEYDVEMAARQKRRDAWVKARTASVEAFKAEYDAIGGPISRTIRDHHAPDDAGDCQGCDGWDRENGGPGWPCSTALVLADLHGIPHPIDHQTWAATWTPDTEGERP